MPFEPGNQLRKGKRVPHSGRKPNELKREVAALFEKALPYEARQAIVERIAAKAKHGDLKAAEWVFNRLYGRVASPSDEALAEARTEVAKAQVELIKAQTKGQLSQSVYVDTQTEAFHLATITPEIFQQVSLRTIQVPIALLQRVSEEEWQHYAENQKARQEFIRHVAFKIVEAEKEALDQVYAEASKPNDYEIPPYPAELEGEFTPEKEDEEAEAGEG
jgi:hypothetical protein